MEECRLENSKNCLSCPRGQRAPKGRKNFLHHQIREIWTVSSSFKLSDITIVAQAE